jgi:hypothetical protein
MKTTEAKELRNAKLRAQRVAPRVSIDSIDSVLQTTPTGRYAVSIEAVGPVAFLFSNYFFKLKTTEALEIPVRIEQSEVSKAQYVLDFNAEKNGPLHKQSWVIKQAEKFHKDMESFKQFFCTNCLELWPSNLCNCKQCKSNKNLFSAINDMVPDFSMSVEIKLLFEQLVEDNGRRDADIPCSANYVNI